MKKSIVLLLSIISFSQNNAHQEHVLFTITTKIDYSGLTDDLKKLSDHATEKIKQDTKELKDEFIDQINAAQDETFKKANEIKDDSLQQIDQTLKYRIVAPAAIGLAATIFVTAIAGIIIVNKSNK